MACSNVELALKWFMLCIRNNYEPAFQPAATYATQHGRMKYCRPVLRYTSTLQLVPSQCLPGPCTRTKRPGTLLSTLSDSTNTFIIPLQLKFLKMTFKLIVNTSPLIINCSLYKLLWRNRLARTTVNRKVPSSSLGGSGFFCIFLLCNRIKYFGAMLSFL